MLRIDGKHPTYGATMLIRLRRDGRCIEVSTSRRYYRDMLPEEAAQKLDDVFEEYSNMKSSRRPSRTNTRNLAGSPEIFREQLLSKLPMVGERSRALFPLR